MPEKMTDRILPAEAMEQPDARKRDLDAVIAMLRELDKGVLVMRLKHIGQITVADDGNTWGREIGGVWEADNGLWSILRTPLDEAIGAAEGDAPIPGERPIYDWDI